MFGSSILEIGIGLALMYFILSLMCTTITELITRLVNMRAKMLAEGIRSLLKDPDSVKEVGKYLSGLRKAIKALNDAEATQLFEALGASPQLKQMKQFEKDIAQYVKAHSLSEHDRQNVRVKTEALSRAIRTKTDDVQERLAELQKAIEALKDQEAESLLKELGASPTQQQMKQFAKEIDKNLKKHGLSEPEKRAIQTTTKTLGDAIRWEFGDIQTCLAALGTEIEALDDREATRLFGALQAKPELQQLKPFEKRIEEYLEAVSHITDKQEKIHEQTKALGRIVRLNSFSADQFYAHPLIARLGSQERSGLARLLGRRTPKASKDAVFYISPEDFGLVLLELLAPSSDNNKTEILVEVGKSIQALPDGDLKRSLTALLVGAEGDLTKLRKGIERWFNGSMDAVQGWYRRKAQLITLVIALIVTLCANADTLTVADKLSRDAAFRSTVVAAATKIAEQPPVLTDGGIVTSTQKIQDLQNTLITLDYPIGWPKAENTDVPDPRRWTRANWPSKLFGILLTWLLISLGAPFWYDMLSKLVNLRAAGKPPETTTKPEIPGMDDLTKQVADLKEAVAKLPPSG